MPISTDHLELPASIGTALRRQRQSAGLSTAEVADAAGVSPWLLFLIENAQPLTGSGAGEVLAGIERVCGVLEMDPEPLLAPSRQLLSETVAGAGATSTDDQGPADPATATGWAVPRVGVETGPPTAIVPGPRPTTIRHTEEPTLQTFLALSASSDVIPTGRRGGRPASGRRTTRNHPGGSARALRLASAGAALAVATTAVALFLASGSTPGIRPPTAAAASTRTVTHLAPAGGSAVPGLDTTSPASATLAVGAAHYAFTVTAAASCWTEIRSAGGAVLWAGTLSAGQQETYQADQPTEVLLGAHSVQLAVSWGSHRYTLAPPVAPYTYSLRS